MTNIVDIINNLTINGTAATKVCSLLYKTNNIDTLIELNKLNITGTDLENLFDLCGFEHPLEFLIQTVKYLSSGYVDKSSVIENLRSDSPVPFITKLITPEEDISRAYDQITSRFYKNIRANRDKLRKR